MMNMIAKMYGSKSNHFEVAAKIVKFNRLTYRKKVKDSDDLANFDDVTFLVDVRTRVKKRGFWSQTLSTKRSKSYKIPKFDFKNEGWRQTPWIWLNIDSLTFPVGVKMSVKNNSSKIMGYAVVAKREILIVWTWSRRLKILTIWLRDDCQTSKANTKVCHNITFLLSSAVTEW